jgi:Ca2+:H+ antiporter
VFEKCPRRARHGTNRVSARLQASLLFLATIALLVPSAVRVADSGVTAVFTHQLSVGLSCLLIVACGLGMLFSLVTHRELFASTEHGEEDAETLWAIGTALVLPRRDHCARGAHERGVRRIRAGGR